MRRARRKAESGRLETRDKEAVGAVLNAARRAGCTLSKGGYTFRPRDRRNGSMSQRWSAGMKVLVAFFAFGATACAVTVAALLKPGGELGVVWRLNPEAQLGFQQIGTPLSVLLMLLVGSTCAWAAVGLARQKKWGRRLAIGILAVNLVGDSVSAIVRHDPRTLIGLPIGGAMMVYLWKS